MYPVRLLISIGQSQVSPTDFNSSPPAGIKLETPCFLSNVKMSMSSWFTCSSSLISAFLGSMLIRSHGITLFLTPLLYGTLVRPANYRQSPSFRVLASAKRGSRTPWKGHRPSTNHWIRRSTRLRCSNLAIPEQHVRNPQIVARSAKEIYRNESNLGQVQGFHA